MNNLKKLQRDFSDSVLHAQIDDATESQISADKISKKAAFGIYINNYYGGLTKVLEQTYPVINKLVGEKFFRATAREFIKSNTPASGNLDDYGNGFDIFLKNFPHTKSLPYLPDVAEFEWKYHLCQLSDETAPLTEKDFASLTPENYFELRFTFNPSAHFFSSKFPILKIWQQNQEPIKDPETINLDEGGNNLIMVRKNREVSFVPLDETESKLLQSLQNGKCFSDAFDLAIPEGETFDLALFVNKHIVCGTWSKISS